MNERAAKEMENLREYVGRTFALHMPARYPDEHPPILTGTIHVTVVDVCYDERAEWPALKLNRRIPQPFDPEDDCLTRADQVHLTDCVHPNEIIEDRLVLASASKYQTVVEPYIRAWALVQRPE